MELFIWFVAFLVVGVLFNIRKEKKRRQYLMQKYGNASLVEKLMKGSIWQGQTQGQVIDSLGNPLDVDEKVLKTKVKEVWKYNKSGKNRYNLRVIIENGLVVGWDKK
ncbi:DUF2845 domain-containing protein [Vibrio hepatarius]|uniref:DUF2845 domain-containing protein n=1 Tax=Vibrio hepatarius TaxID=171383 RepID=UPI00373663C7